MIIAQRTRRFDRSVRRDMARVALDAELAGFPALAEAGGEEGGVGVVAVGVEEAGGALQNCVGAFEAAFGEARGEDAGLGGAAEMQALDHRAVAGVREGEEAARERAGDAERLAEAVGVEAQRTSRDDGGAVRPGEAGGVEAERLAAVA